MIRIFLILFFSVHINQSFLLDLNSEEIQPSEIQECFEIWFVNKNFDSVFYSHDHKTKEQGFFIKHDEHIENLLSRFSHENQILFNLNNGNFLSIVPIGYFFIEEIEYFIHITDFEINDNQIIIDFEEIEYNGVTQKILCKKKVIFIKPDHWTLFNIIKVDKK